MIRFWERVRNLFSLMLFFMILSRVVWLQLRPYHVMAPPVVALSQSQWFCAISLGQTIEPLLVWVCALPWVMDSVIAWNLKVFFFTVAILMISVRILSRSWVVAMACGTILLSRGSLTSMMGYATPDGLMMLILAMWVTVGSHAIVSASVFLLIVFLLLLLALGVSSSAFLFFGCLPLAICCSFLTVPTPVEKIDRGGIFRRSGGRFAVWVKQNPIIWLVCLSFSVLHFGMAMYRFELAWSEGWPWSLLLTKSIDVHYFVSVLAIFWGWRWHPQDYCREIACFLSYVILLAIFSQSIVGQNLLGQFYLEGAHPVFKWIEPIVLAHGASFLFDIFKICFEWTQQKRRQVSQEISIEDKEVCV